MKLHLYEFSLNDDKNNAVYVISSLPTYDIRKCVDAWDHGNIPNDIFYKTLEKGNVREIVELEEELYDISPFTTGEQVYAWEIGRESTKGKYFLDIDTDIQGFFEEYYRKEYPDELIICQ